MRATADMAPEHQSTHPSGAISGNLQLYSTDDLLIDAPVWA